MFKRIAITMLAALAMVASAGMVHAQGDGGKPPDTTTGGTTSVFDEDVTINADLTVSGVCKFPKIENVIDFDNGHAMITVHDGFGNFNLLSGIDNNNKITVLDGGSRLRMDANGIFYLESYSGAVGEAGEFASRLYLNQHRAIFEGCNVGIGVLQPAEALEVAGKVKWGGQRGMLTTSQGASIELGGASCIPFIDFTNDMTTDYDMRLILNDDDELKVAGGNLMVEGNISLGASRTLYAPGRMHIDGEETLYLLNQDGVRISKSWGGNGNLTVEGSGTFGGTVTTGSSRELKKNINRLSGEKAVEALMSLVPVEYNYKTNADELELGFIAEDVPDLVARNDRKSLSPMDFAALSVTVIQGQQSEISNLRSEIDQLKTLVNELVNNK